MARWQGISSHVLTTDQGSKFHSSDRLRRVKMTVGQVEYLQDLSDGRLHISDFHICCIGFISFRQVNGTFGQVMFTVHLPDGQVHSIWNFEACWPSSPTIFWPQHQRGAWYHSFLHDQLWISPWIKLISNKQVRYQFSHAPVTIVSSLDCLVMSSAIDCDIISKQS